MNKLKAKLNKQGGFTLIEMLIVVAIIAILIAISIPLVNNALERARESTDAANERSFKAELTIAYLSESKAVAGGGDFATGTVYAYDAQEGVLVTSAPTTKYGKSTSVNVTDAVDRKDAYLIGMVSDDGTVTMRWTKADTMPGKVTGVGKDIELISSKFGG